MNVNLAETVAKKEGYKKVVCRLCGMEWWYPDKLAAQFNSEYGLECCYCKKGEKE